MLVPNVQELALEGKILSRSHVKNERSRVENYWIPKLKGKCIGSITNDMLKDIVSDKKIQKLAGKTINSIVESITTPLKWAMKNQYIENISFFREHGLLSESFHQVHANMIQSFKTIPLNQIMIF